MEPVLRSLRAPPSFCTTVCITSSLRSRARFARAIIKNIELELEITIESDITIENDITIEIDITIAIDITICN